MGAAHSAQSLRDFEAEPATQPAISETVAEDETLYEVGILNDDDSGLEACTETVSDTLTMNSQWNKVILRNGRSYHSYHAGVYMLPNDETEQDRLDAQHRLWLHTLGGRHYLASISTPMQAILDIGTGTGIWAIDVAEDTPSAAVSGVDLSPIQPKFVPPNLTFIVDDLEDAWIQRDHYDLIFGRDLTFCFKNPPAVLEGAFQALKPGGYMEFQNFNLPLTSDYVTLTGTAFERWTNLVIEGAKRLGQPYWGQAQWWKTIMGQVGLVDIQEKRYCWPIGACKGKHLKILGLYARATLLSRDGLHAISAQVLTDDNGMRMNSREVEDLLKQIVQEIGDGRIQASIPVTVIFGRKPL